MQQDDEYEEEEEAQVHDNNNIVKNNPKGTSPTKGKNVKAASKSPIPDKKSTVVNKKEEKKSVSASQQVNINNLRTLKDYLETGMLSL